jgi:hypothetical protein
MNDLPLRPVADIGAVEDRFFTLRNFVLTDGTVMPEARHGLLAIPNGMAAAITARRRAGPY